MNTVEGWEIKRLDEIGTIVSGSTPSTSIRSFWDGDIVWVTPNDLSKLNTPYLCDSTKRITEKGLSACSSHLMPVRSIVMSSRAPIGYVAIPTVEFCTNQGCKSIKLKSDFHPEFTYYNVLFNIHKIKNLGEGTTFAEISKRALSTVELSFPLSVSEQVKIAEILTTVDRAIEQTEALIAKQQRIKTGLMQDLLTRGIDEHGNLRSEQTHKFKDSPLGRIPMEWEVERLDDLLVEKRYGISTSLSEEPIGIPVLRMNNLVNGEVDFTDLKYSERKDAKNLTLDDGDVLFNRTNSIDYVGRTGIYRHSGQSVSFASYLVRLVPDNVKLHSEYLNLWLNDGANQIRVKQFATIGVQQANVNPTNLGTLSIALPKAIIEQEQIIDAISTASNSIHAIDETLHKLRFLKAALMQDLLTGSKRVTPLLYNAEAFTE
jgi:type I restriction enzyme S subunit